MARTVPSILPIGFFPTIKGVWISQPRERAARPTCHRQVGSPNPTSSSTISYKLRNLAIFKHQNAWKIPLIKNVTCYSWELSIFSSSSCFLCYKKLLVKNFFFFSFMTKKRFCKSKKEPFWKENYFRLSR
jgi:hypothetical protein